MSVERRPISKGDLETINVALRALQSHALGIAHEPLDETISYYYEEFRASGPHAPRDSLPSEEWANSVFAHAILVVEALIREESELPCHEITAVPWRCAAPQCRELTFTGYCSQHRCQLTRKERSTTACSR
jgi:hypothetical protein